MGQQRPGITTLRQVWKKAVLGSSAHLSGLQSCSDSVVGFGVVPVSEPPVVNPASVLVSSVEDIPVTGDVVVRSDSC